MKALLLITALVLSGCANLDSRNFFAPDPDASYGPQPTLAEFEASARTHFEVSLKDPFSAQYRFSPPDQCFIRGAPVTQGKITHYGWCGSVLVNAKNSFGGYVGWKSFRLFYHDGEVREFSGNMWFKEPWLSEGPWVSKGRKLQ